MAEIAASKDTGGAEEGANAGVDTGKPKRVSPIKKMQDAQAEHHAAMQEQAANMAKAHAELAQRAAPPPPLRTRPIRRGRSR